MGTDLETENDWKRQELLDVMIGITTYIFALLGLGPILLWMLIY